MGSGFASAPRRTVARFVSIVLAAGLFGGCASHGSQPVDPGSSVAADDPAAEAPAVPSAHRIRLPLTRHHARHRHAGPR